MPKPNINKRKKEEDAGTSSDSGPEDLEPPKKETKTVKPKTGSGDDEEASFELSKNKVVKVRTFKNHLQVDIREYYLDAKGNRLPGKRGIALSAVQWEELKAVIPDIDAAVKERM